MRAFLCLVNDRSWPEAACQKLDFVHVRMSALGRLLPAPWVEGII